MGFMLHWTLFYEFDNKLLHSMHLDGNSNPSAGLSSSRVAAMWMCLNMAQLHGLLLSSPTCNYAVRMASMCGHYILAQLCWFCLCLHEKMTRVWTRVLSCVTIRKTEQGRRRKYEDFTRRLDFNCRFHVFIVKKNPERQENKFHSDSQTMIFSTRVLRHFVKGSLKRLTKVHLDLPYNRFIVRDAENVIGLFQSGNEHI